MKWQKARQNKFEIECDIAKIWLHGNYGDGNYAIIDTDDIDKIKCFNWRMENGYVISIFRENDRHRGYIQRKIFLHRFLLGVTSRKIVVFHKNGDKLDNRRENLVKMSRSDYFKKHLKSC